jgi:hypothetical protein
MNLCNNENEFWYYERNYKISGFHSCSVAATAPLRHHAVHAGSCFNDFWNSLMSHIPGLTL